MKYNIASLAIVFAVSFGFAGVIYAANDGGGQGGMQPGSSKGSLGNRSPAIPGRCRRKRPERRARNKNWINNRAIQKHHQPQPGSRVMRASPGIGLVNRVRGRARAAAPVLNQDRVWEAGKLWRGGPEPALFLLTL